VDEPVEVIVVDDDHSAASADSPSEQVFDGLVVRRVRTAEVVKGPAAARNLGVSVAKYDLIALTDDDARCDDQWLAVGAAQLRSNPQIAGVEGAVRIDVDAPIDPIRGRIVTNERGGAYLTASLFARADAIRSIGGFRRLRHDGNAWAIPYREDTDLALRLIELIGPVPFAAEAFVFHPVEQIDLRRLVTLARFFVVDGAFARLHPDAVPALWRRPLVRVRIRLATAITLLTPLLALPRTRRQAAAAILVLAAGVSAQLEVELRSSGIRRGPGTVTADTLRRLPRSLLWSLVAGSARLQGEAMVALGLVDVAAHTPDQDPFTPPSETH
jgi:hypothetical protein